MTARLDRRAVPAVPSAFEGATLRLYDTELLVIHVAPAVLADRYESQLLVVAFAARFARTIVLVARDAAGIPTYFGPSAIARALAALPFDALTWRRYRFHRPAPAMLPIPRDPTRETDSRPSWSFCPTPDTALGETTIRVEPAATLAARPRSR
jgi:hypothetical protein